jgi:hypothetical protein
MTRLLTLLLAIVCSTALVAAQGAYPPAQQPATPQPSAGQPAQQPSSPATSSAPAASTADKVTYTGCLKPGTKAGTWVLENAQVAPAAGAAATAASAVGTSGASTSKQTFNLTVKPTDNLTPHANHKIEITGVASPASSMSTRPDASSTSDTAMARQNFTVDSFKMVSATCP